MSVTKAELRNLILRHIGALAAGETPSADDASEVESAYEQVRSMLELDEVADWAATDAIPTYAVRPMVRLVGYEMAGTFEIPEQRMQRLAIEAQMAKQELLVMVSGRYTPSTVKAEYY